ncbi:MAG: hypothetical protein BJ554DRAFT_613 [Olpidium bornovanus]|uniref:Transmembrane protein 198 n=1 Tax=Olpidium bornovanus TaxID=278681 RepID=A0A8H7ZTT0_9FUNG|nr:MAG: hypothetical protein BJ554DRAFT_613 [Olpidium bornovanus]
MQFAACPVRLAADAPRMLASAVACALPLLSVAAAQDGGAAAAAVADAVNVSVSSGVVGVICILFGLLFCFFGTSMWRITLFVAGFFFSFVFVYGILLNLEGPLAGGSYGPNRDWIIFGVSIAGGLLGACIAGCLYKIGIFLMGAVGGFLLATWIVSFLAGDAITSGSGRVAFILGLAVVFGVLALFVEKHIVIFATAYAGAYEVVYGIDQFVGSGFSSAADAALTDVRSNASLDGAVAGLRNAKFAKPGVAYGLVVGMFVLALLGMVVQYRRYRPFGGKSSKSGSV